MPGANAIIEDHLADQAVTTRCLRDGAVTAAKLTAPNAAAGNGAAGSLGINQASGWATIVSTPFTPKRGDSSSVYLGYFTGFIGSGGPGVLVQARITVDGVQVGGIVPCFYNASLDHRSWSPQVCVASPSAGVAHTIALQVQCGSAGFNFNMDGNDVSTIIAAEV